MNPGRLKRLHKADKKMISGNVKRVPGDYNDEPIAVKSAEKYWFTVAKNAVIGAGPIHLLSPPIRLART